MQTLICIFLLMANGYSIFLYVHYKVLKRVQLDDFMYFAIIVFTFSERQSIFIKISVLNTKAYVGYIISLVYFFLEN